MKALIAKLTWLKYYLISFNSRTEKDHQIISDDRVITSNNQDKRIYHNQDKKFLLSLQLHDRLLLIVVD